MFMEDDAPPIDGHAKELMDWRAVETKPGSDAAFSRHDEINVEMKIRNIAAILFEHCPIAIHTKQAPVVNHIGGHEIAKLFPGTGIQTGNVSLVQVGCCPLAQ